MSPECGPWRSCDFHQYRSWLRKTDCATPNSTPADKEKQKVKKLRRRSTPGEFQLTFRHHTDPSEYERDYLTQVTHPRCRAANPSATLLATELTSVRSSGSASDSTVVQLLPPQPSPSAERRFPAAPAPAAAPAAARAAAPAAAPAAASAALVRPLFDTASTPDLSVDSATPPPRPTPPTSSPDFCHLPKITVGARALRRRSLPPSSSTASPAGPTSTASTTSAGAYCNAAGQHSGQAVGQPPAQPPARQARSVSVQREGGDQLAAAGGTPRSRRQLFRQTSTPHTVTLDLPSPLGFGSMAQARNNSYKPRGLTKIQLASSVPENLTIIVGRKLEISLSGAKRSRQRGRGFR